MSAREKFYRAVEQFVYPALRKEGFTCSGSTLRSLTSNTVMVFSFQDRREGGSSCVNMGAHPLFLPTRSGRVVSGEEIDEPACEFRQRLAPEGQVGRWWPHERSKAELACQANEILELYLSAGRRFYAIAANILGLLASITPDDVSKGNLADYPGVMKTPVRAALTLARLCQHIGRSDAAAVFARVGLENCGRAVALRPEFRKIIASEPPLFISVDSEGPPSVT